MHSTKTSWIGIDWVQTRLFGVMVAVLSVVCVSAWANQPTQLVVNVGEALKLEVESATQVALAEPTIADAVITSKKEILVNGKKPGVTTLNIWEESGAQKTYRIVVVEGEYPSKTIQEAINVPSIQVRVAGNAVILEGAVATERELERALNIASAYREKVVNLVEVTNPVQVRIRVQVADVRLNALENKGLQYPDSVTYSMDLIGENVLNNNFSELGGGVATATILHGFSATEGSIPNEPGERDASLFVKMNLLKQNGDLRVLAEPTLVTLSGKEASFLAGGEFPVVIALQNSFSVEFKEFGVRMKIKPTVDSKENINTTISAELSAIDPTLSVSSSSVVGGVDIPGLTSRKANTTLQVKSGQTILIGGLLDRQTIESLRKVPWIGEVPILGLLFTSKAKERVDRELIFLATLDLVRDADAEAKAALKSKTMKDMMSEPAFETSEKEWQRLNRKGMTW